MEGREKSPLARPCEPVATKGWRQAVHLIVPTRCRPRASDKPMYGDATSDYARDAQTNRDALPRQTVQGGNETACQRSTYVTHRCVRR